jgi:hypothetical protein
LGRNYSLADGTHINLAILSLVMAEKAMDEPQPLDLKIDDIDSSSNIVIEDSISMTFTELDYTTLTPMGLITEIFVTFSCKVEGEIKKVRMDVPHFLVICKNAKKRRIRIKKGKNYVHLEKDESGKQRENRDFDILDFIEKCITREKDEVGDMFV